MRKCSCKNFVFYYIFLIDRKLLNPQKSFDQINWVSTKNKQRRLLISLFFWLPLVVLIILYCTIARKLTAKGPPNKHAGTFNSVVDNFFLETNSTRMFWSKLISFFKGQCHEKSWESWWESNSGLTMSRQLVLYF